MRVVDFINELSQHPGAAEVADVMWDDATGKVWIDIKKPEKPKKPKKAKKDK